MKVKFGSVCSGIEAASVAWNPLGFKASWLSEIERFPAELLAYRYPDVRNVGDMLKAPSMVRSGEIPAPDILVGGTPCQSFSVAGMRQGLNDERGQLTMSFVDLANEIDKQRVKNGEQESITVWENVPGVLSSKDNAFGCFLGALAGESCELQPAGRRWTNAGYILGPQRAIAWRVLDAQYFGVAQRRRRVFVVASARDGFCPAKVLFEFEGVRRDTPPSREAGKEVTGNAGEGVKNAGSHGELVGALDTSNPQAQAVVTCATKQQSMTCEHDLASTIAANDYKEPQSVAIAGTQNDYFRDATNNLAPTLRSGGIGGGGVKQAVAVGAFKAGQGAAAGSIGFSEYLSPTLTSAESGSNRTPALLYETAVRRLTPIECERLQGFPDFYTMIPWRNKPAEDCPDGHRYKALGNSMAVPVMRWIGERILNELKGEL